MSEEKKQISYGQLVKKADFQATPLIPSEAKGSLKEEDNYLFIYIPSDDIIKISIFPCPNSEIKKILIRLKEFSPDLVKGISDVLKNFNLGSSTIHTTGLCFSGTNCFYETYIATGSLNEKNITLAKIKEDFLAVPRVVSVDILEIPSATL